MQYVYDFARLDRAVLGQDVICTLGTQARGTGAKAHSHPNEQFNYILQGAMMSDIEGDRVFATRGTILHTPGSVVHTELASPDQDLVFLAIKDTRTGTAGAIEESGALPPGPGKRYVYDMRNTGAAWAGNSSAKVFPDADLRLPPGVTGKLLSGERLHVGVLRFERGATLSNYRRDNEQLVFVVEGELEADVGEEELAVGTRSILHVPRGTKHQLYAPEGATVVIAQDAGGGRAKPAGGDK